MLTLCWRGADTSPLACSHFPGEWRDAIYLRLRLTKTLPREAWSETVDEYRGRLKLCAAHANANHDVDGLCRGLLKRVEELHRRKGDRLSQ